MALHLRVDAFHIAQEINVAELVELVGTDGLIRIMLAEDGQVDLARAYGSHTGSRERNLAGGSKENREIDVMCLAALMPEVQQLIRRIGEVVHAIGIVPENAEILCRGLQGSKTAHRLIGIGIALRVAVFRHTPDTLDLRIVVHPALHFVHVGAFRRHLNGNQLHAEILGDGKMAIITGRRAQEFQVTLMHPGLAVAEAMRHGAGDNVKHHVEARVAADNDIVIIDAHHFCKQQAKLRQAVGHAVVAAVLPRGSGHLGTGIQRVQHGHGKLKLLHARLAARHVQIQPLLSDLAIPVLQIFLDVGKLFPRHCLKFQIAHLPFSKCKKPHKTSFIVIDLLIKCKIKMRFLHLTAFISEKARRLPVKCTI